MNTFTSAACVVAGRTQAPRWRSLHLMAAVAALAACVLPATTHAAEVKVFTSVALKSVLDELAPAYEKATGNKLTISYGLAAEQKKRVLAGETADVIMLTRAMMEDLQKQNKLAGGLVNVAGTPVAVVARAGAPKPDIGSVEAFKKTLLAARSIVYADPAKGGLSGVVFARALERLGIAGEMKAKTILVPGAQAAEVVAKGDAELGRRPGLGDRAGRRRAAGRSASRRARERHAVHGGRRQRERLARGRQGADRVPDRAAGGAAIPGERLSAGMSGTAAAM